MDVIILESQLESLFFNHLGNFDFLTFISTSLWTWVAAVLAAAALSLWKIKSSTLVVVVVDSASASAGSHFLPPTNKSDDDDDGYVLLHHQQPAAHEEKEEEESQEDITPSYDSCIMYTRIDEVYDGMTKRKFTTVYFEENFNEDGDGGKIVADYEARNEEDIKKVLFCSLESLEGMMYVKREMDLGWYRYQDITALSGSVVKLWDEERPW